MAELSDEPVTNNFTGSKLPQKTGDPSIDYAPPTTDIVTVEGLDVTRFPQGSMVAVHQLRLPSHAPYLDDAKAQGNSTEDQLNTVSQEGIVTPSGLFHAGVKANFDGADPYAPVEAEVLEVAPEEVVDEPVVETVPTAEVTPIGSAPLSTPIVVN